MEKFIYDYFVEPIRAHSGYNVVNTLVYAAIAIILVYALFKLLKRMKIAVDRHFVLSVLAFVLFGSTVRVVTDSIDSGVFKPVTPLHAFVINSHIWDYPPEGTTNILQYWTVSPGIYIFTAVLLLASLAILYKMKRTEWLGYAGLALWLPHLLLLIPFMNYWIFAFIPLIMAAVPWLLAKRLVKEDILAGIVFAHALDGAATFTAIDVFPIFTGIQYSEQHVFSSNIGILGGSFFVFYLVKVLISLGAAYLINREKMPEDEKYYISLVLIIMGLAPGIRDILRMMVGG